MEPISGGQLSRKAKAALLSSHAGDPRAAAGDRSFAGQSTETTQHSRVSPPPARGPTGQVGRHRPDATDDDSDSTLDTGARRPQPHGGRVAAFVRKQHSQCPRQHEDRSGHRTRRPSRISPNPRSATDQFAVGASSKSPGTETTNHRDAWPAHTKLPAVLVARYRCSPEAAMPTDRVTSSVTRAMPSACSSNRITRPVAACKGSLASLPACHAA